MNKIIKIISVIQRTFIKLISYINLNLYMKLYTKYLRKCGIKINGYPKYIHPSVYFDGADYSKIKIGDNVTISKEVMLLTHDYSLTTALASIGRRIDRGEGEVFFLNEINIGENCFIGARTSILPGSIIGDNVIIGACSVIKGTIPSNSIVVGNPCKVIGKTSDFANKHLNKNDFFSE